MQYRVDPKSGNRISALGLGCMRFPGAPGHPDAKTADAIISRAVEQGINYLDTAYLYPGNEVCVGASLERLGLRDRVLLATKLPHASCKCAEDFDRFFDEQLHRLRTDHIDYYLMHNITSPAQWERVVALGIEDWIAHQKAAGRIRQIGFSYHAVRRTSSRCLTRMTGIFARSSTTTLESATKRERRDSWRLRSAGSRCL